MVTGGEVQVEKKARLLSDEGSDEYPAMWMVSGGRSGDGGPGGVLHDDAATTAAAAKLAKEEARPKTLKARLWLR